MQVICSGAAKCNLPCEDGHNVPHMQCQACPVTCYGGAVCIPVQSDFERGQEELRKIFSKPCPYQTTWWFNRKRTLEFAGDSLFDNRGVVWQFDSTSEKMPKGICRNCGHPKYTHYHWDDKCDYCDCKKFLAEPLAPTEKRKPSAVEETIIYWKESYEAGKADCAKTHEALRNEGRKSGYKQGVEESCIDYEEAKKDGRKEVVEWVEGNVRLLCTRADWQNKKEEWGL